MFKRGKWQMYARDLIETCWDAYEDESYRPEATAEWGELRAMEFCWEHIQNIYANGDEMFMFTIEKQIENELKKENGHGLLKKLEITI